MEIEKVLLYHNFYPMIVSFLYYNNSPSIVLLPSILNKTTSP